MSAAQTILRLIYERVPESAAEAVALCLSVVPEANAWVVSRLRKELHLEINTRLISSTSINDKKLDQWASRGMVMTEETRELERLAYEAVALRADALVGPALSELKEKRDRAEMQRVVADAIRKLKDEERKAKQQARDMERFEQLRREKVAVATRDAAPEMLSVLESIVRWYPDGNLTGPPTEILAARAVIAKVRSAAGKVST